MSFVHLTIEHDLNLIVGHLANIFVRGFTWRWFIWRKMNGKEGRMKKKKKKEKMVFVVDIEMVQLISWLRWRRKRERARGGAARHRRLDADAKVLFYGQASHTPAVWFTSTRCNLFQWAVSKKQSATFRGETRRFRFGCCYRSTKNGVNVFEAMSDCSIRTQIHKEQSCQLEETILAGNLEQIKFTPSWSKSDSWTTTEIRG